MTRSLDAALGAILAARPSAPVIVPLGPASHRRVEVMQAPLWLYTLCRNLSAAGCEGIAGPAMDVLQDEFRLQWEGVVADLSEAKAAEVYRRAHALSERGYAEIEGCDLPTAFRAIRLFVDELGRRGRLPPGLFRLAWSTLRGIVYTAPEWADDIVKAAVPSRTAAESIVRYYEAAGYLLGSRQ